jgi:hypothetical protein
MPTDDDCRWMLTRMMRELEYEPKNDKQDERCRRLLASGHLQRTTRGNYRITQTGAEAANAYEWANR